MPDAVPETMPIWEQRIRTPQLLSFSLLGPAVSWATDRADAGALLSTLSGRAEVYAFDATEVPARLTQLTDRPHGTTGAMCSPDGTSVFWFDDSAGDEVGRWIRHDLATGDEVTILSDDPPAYSAGIRALPDGGVVVGRLVGDGFVVSVVDAVGDGRHAYELDEPAYLADATDDASLAIISFAPNGDWLHRGVRMVRLADGQVIAELARDGTDLDAVAFHPNDPGRVLIVYEPSDRRTPAVWHTTTGTLDDVETRLEGDVSAAWYPKGDALLVTSLDRARHTLSRLDLSTDSLIPIPVPPGTIAESSARPDGSVHVLMSRSDQPVTLLRVGTDGSLTELVALSDAPPPPTVAARDVVASGPGGEVHGLVQVPADGSGPFPAVFLPHGGPTAQDFDTWDATNAGLVDAGYAVVRVNYRGSTGYGAEWRDALHERVGFIELEDIGAIRRALESQGLIDPTRVSIAGGSWGGYLTLMALGLEPDRWRSGVAMVPVADWFTMTEDSPPFMVAFDRALFGASIDEVPALYQASSPITYVDNVTAPVFITAGANDPRCPVRQIDLYVEALRSRGHEVTYDRLEAGHGLADLDMRVIEVRTMLEFVRATNPA